MFRSKIRPINLPQYEHAKLAGVLASHWGNADFPRPSIDFAGFVQGVTLHDWNYRLLDNLPILGMSDEERLAIFRKGIAYHFADATTDIVVQLHLRRLLGWWGSAESQPLIDQIDERIAARVMETANTLSDFYRADTITNLCDIIAFHFGFEAEKTGQVAVYVNESEKVDISYRIAPDEPICISPWPFDVPSFSGLLIAYARDGYPETLRPIVLPYFVRPG